jgi:hypothetical protein
VRLYIWTFDKEPALADDLAKRHRYDAARCAVLAAAGKDKDMPTVEPAEWGWLTGLAMSWLRADLDRMTALAKDPERHPQLREWLTKWKEDPDLAPVRDPASLAAMAPADAEEWRSLWRDADALLASTNRPAPPAPGKP